MSCNLNTYRLTYTPSPISLSYANEHKARFAISVIRSMMMRQESLATTRSEKPSAGNIHRDVRHVEDSSVEESNVNHAKNSSVEEFNTPLGVRHVEEFSIGVRSSDVMNSSAEEFSRGHTKRNTRGVHTIKTDNHKAEPYDVDLFEYMPSEYRDLTYSVFAAYKRRVMPLIMKYKDVFVWRGSHLNISAEIKTCKVLIPEIYKRLERACMSGKADSHMSEYIALGLFSMQLLFHLALKHNNQDILDQFIWRVFYYSASNLSDRVLWKYNSRRHEAFCQCMTGYEYVDAIMNCLIETGYITNRQRMLVGSFYCKILYLPWREGSLIFERYLSDYDYKLNIGNWLWCSQIQFDNQIFIRHFSPDIQARKYDHDRTFRIKWLPYLSEDETISALQTTKVKRPKPIVDYSSAKEMFRKNLRS